MNRLSGTPTKANGAPPALVARAARRTGRASGTRLATRRSPLATRHLPRPVRPAFTLTELLIVISIIAILASLAVVAARSALRTAQRSRIQIEIQNLSGVIEALNAKHGVYPPNTVHDGTNNNALGEPVLPIVEGDLQRTLKRMFPRHQEPQQLLDALVGAGANPQLPGGMNAFEALYFWTGGFSDDPRYPISGPGGPSFLNATGDVANSRDEILEDRNRPDEIKITQLGPRDENGQFAGRSIVYRDPITGDNRQINLWMYTPAGSEQPLAYFDVSRHKWPEYHVTAFPYDPTAGDAAYLYPITKLREGVTTVGDPMQDVMLANQGKSQILHSGLDDDWGSFNAFDPQSPTPVVFPEGPFLGPMADTLTNFTTGTLEQEVQ